MDFVLGPRNESLLQKYDRWRGRADPKVCCDYSLHMGLTWWGPQVRDEMEIIVKEKGINSFKVFMAFKDVYMLRDDEVRNMGWYDSIKTVCFWVHMFDFWVPKYKLALPIQTWSKQNRLFITRRNIYGSSAACYLA